MKRLTRRNIKDFITKSIFGDLSREAMALVDITTDEIIIDIKDASYIDLKYLLSVLTAISKSAYVDTSGSRIDASEDFLYGAESYMIFKINRDAIRKDINSDEK